MNGLAIVGGGNMGTAFLATALSGPYTPAEVSMVEPDAERAADVRKTYGVAVRDLRAAVAAADTVAFVVKPYLLESIIAQLDGVLTDEHLIVSLAGGLGAARIEAAAPTARPPVVRCCPNLAIAVGQGLTAISGGAHAEPA